MSCAWALTLYWSHMCARLGDVPTASHVRSFGLRPTPAHRCLRCLRHTQSVSIIIIICAAVRLCGYNGRCRLLSCLVFSKTAKLVSLVLRIGSGAKGTALAVAQKELCAVISNYTVLLDAGAHSDGCISVQRCYPPAVMFMFMFIFIVIIICWCGAVRYAGALADG